MNPVCFFKCWNHMMKKEKKKNKKKNPKNRKKSRINKIKIFTPKTLHCMCLDTCIRLMNYICILIQSHNLLYRRPVWVNCGTQWWEGNQTDSRRKEWERVESYKAANFIRPSPAGVFTLTLLSKFRLCHSHLRPCRVKTVLFHRVSYRVLRYQIHIPCTRLDQIRFYVIFPNSCSTQKHKKPIESYN